MHSTWHRCFVTLLTAAMACPCQVLTQGARSPSPSPPLKEGSIPVAIFVVEAVAFGTAALARSETGARVVGTIDGVSGLAVLAIAGFPDRQSGMPEFMVPYGIGLLGLSYYDFAAASSGRRDRRFWTNAIGFNAAVLAGVLSGTLLGRQDMRRGVSVHVSPSRVFVSIPF